MASTKYFPVVFAPDLDPSWGINPGVLTDVQNMVPTKRGTLQNYACATTLGTTFSESTYSTPLTGAIIKKVDGTARLFVATLTRLMEATDTSTWIDRSKGAADYSFTSDNHRYDEDWQFTSYGNDVIAVSKSNNPQVINASSAFADLGGSPPKAACCTTNKNFVLLGNCNNGVNDLGDQIWWSGLGNDATWTADAATQAGNYRLLDTPGNVTALVNMRESVIAYKEDSVYLGDYQGSPLLWTWRLITDKVGCASPHGVAIVDGIHYFCHRTGIFRFDGASVQPIGPLINNYLCVKLGDQSKYATAHAVYDESSSLILWYFNTTADSTAYTRQHALAFNPKTGQYGYVTDGWDTGICRGVVKATLSDIAAWQPTLGTTANTTSNILLVGQVVSTTNAVIKTVRLGDTNSSATMSITTGDIGDDMTFAKVTGVKARWLSYSGTLANMTVSGRKYQGDTASDTATFTADATNARWDGAMSRRIHYMTVPISTYGELAGLFITSVPAGAQ